MLQEIKILNRTLLSDAIAKNTELGFFQIVKVINNRNVKVNGRRIGEDVYVNTGDIINIYIKDREKDNIEIVFQDTNILVANKMAGIEVEGEDSLTTRLNAQLDEITVKAVHRLDRNTMGLVLFALNDVAEKELLKVFKDRELDKQYYCLVSGQPKKSEILKDFLFKDSKKSQVYVSSTQKVGYSPIETHYKFIKRKGELSLLDVTLVTGRTHQIRAHLAFHNLPIVGDGKYGVNAISKKYKVKQQALYCYKLTFHFEKNSPLHYLDSTVVKTDIDLFDLVTF
ncbi:MAG: RluA family pseudouridine synthase [Clostridia bacterium]